MEVAVCVDETDICDERFGVDEFVEGDETVFHLSDGGDHVTVEFFFDECDVCANAEASAEHDIVSMGACATCFITELYAVDFDFGEVTFFKSFHDHFGDEVSEVDIAE